MPPHRPNGVNARQTSLQLTPTSHDHAHHGLNKVPSGSIGLRVVIGTISMTIMTEATQSVIEYNYFSHRSILLVPCKNEGLSSKLSFLPTFAPVYSAALHLFRPTYRCSNRDTDTRARSSQALTNSSGQMSALYTRRPFLQLSSYPPAHHS